MRSIMFCFVSGCKIKDIKNYWSPIYSEFITQLPLEYSVYFNDWVKISRWTFATIWVWVPCGTTEGFHLVSMKPSRQCLWLLWSWSLAASKSWLIGVYSFDNLCYLPTADKPACYWLRLICFCFFVLCKVSKSHDVCVLENYLWCFLGNIRLLLKLDYDQDQSSTFFSCWQQSSSR